ncbi:DEAD/DEAH box helicase family protein [Prolixibacteraceae bacterium]|nr:DEAD/DEAH box helicase family protein [Prolixibacteraceae bacterium]
MTSNFSFLQSEWPEIYERAKQAEQMAKSDPRASLTFSRMGLEMALHWIYEYDHYLEKPMECNLMAMLQVYEFKSMVPHGLYGTLHLIRKRGNGAVHNYRVTLLDAMEAVEDLFAFLRWMARSYQEEDQDLPTCFDGEAIPEKGAQELRLKELKRTVLALTEEREQYAETLEKERRLQEELLEKNAQLEAYQQERQMRWDKQRVEASKESDVHYPVNEAETRRKFIDLSLREAGWDTEAPNMVEYKLTHIPTTINTSGTGYADYVLWGSDGKPLAVVEAKKASVQAEEGKIQAMLYADALEKMHGVRPFVFYTNGFETYFYDDCFYGMARRVYGFYTQKELTSLMFRRGERKSLRLAEIDQDIAGRMYQQRSIRKIAEHWEFTDKETGHLRGRNRAALLVLATGTGKTRTATALSKMMLSCNWAKRILFLADRTVLVNQACGVFGKMLPDCSVANLLDPKQGKGSGSDERIVFSTYQTMINQIDRQRVGDQRYYGIGHFDLIIIDEAHRSIYNKYKSIFRYFDAMMLGLTATPKRAIDTNTFEAFEVPEDQPTDEYTFEEGVGDGFLSPYQSLEVPTKFMTEGIRYASLSAKDKQKFEDQFLKEEDPNAVEVVDKSELDRWIYNKDTAKKCIAFFVKNAIRVEGGDRFGKSIVFARNQRHAEFLAELFRAYDKTQFTEETVQVVTNKTKGADHIIQQFSDPTSKSKLRIAISVDMMDTGVDAPEVVNLMFYKPVKSYSKFWQMIGRGSRLSPDLLGYGQDKERFLIFDYCGNFEYFEENPHGVENSKQESRLQKVLGLELEIAHMLSHANYQKEETLVAFRKNLLDRMHGRVVMLDESRYEVKLESRTVLDYQQREVWHHLSEKDVHVIKEKLIPLIPGVDGDTDDARGYDQLLYHLIKVRLETPKNSVFTTIVEGGMSKVYDISKNLLKKCTIPQVKQAQEEIKAPMEESFWNKRGVAHLERLRTKVRDLVRHVDREVREAQETNFIDQILDDKVKMTQYEDQVAQTGANYRLMEMRYNKERLEALMLQHSDHMTIQRMRRKEAISQEELSQLEAWLFDHQVSKEDIDFIKSEHGTLERFIVTLVGLDKEKVDAAFATFVNTHTLNSKQIAFLTEIKRFYTTQGVLDQGLLFEGAPFKRIDSKGVFGVFHHDTDKILNIVETLNEGLVG